MERNEAISLLQGGDIKEFNKRRREAGAMPSLEKADLQGKTFAFIDAGDFSRSVVVDFRSIDLRGADLRRAALTGAHFEGARLEKANLREAKLYGAHFDGAVLTGADLRDADLSHADLRGARLSEALLEGATLTSVRGMRLDGNNLSNVRFPPYTREFWHVLRRTYTGPAMLFHLILIVAFLGAYAFKTAVWVGVGTAQHSVLETVRNLEISLRADAAARSVSGGAGDASVAAALNRTADVLARLQTKQRFAGQQYPVWKVLLGVDHGWWAAILPLALIVYNTLRIALTKSVSAMREEEERSGYAPVWAAEVPEPYAPAVRWFYVRSNSFRALRALIYGHSHGYALYWKLHRCASVLLWVAVGTFIWHLVGWLTVIVWLPA